MISNPGSPWRKSKKLTEKNATKRRHLDEYFQQFGEAELSFRAARCQVCGDVVYRHEADWCHLRHEGMGGGVRRTVKTNGICAHGFRSGPANCHKWIDNKPKRLKIIIDQGVNMVNGECVKWDEQRRLNLIKWQAKGEDKFSDL